MVIMTKNYAVRNSIRYDQPDENKGPLSVYIPKDWFIGQGIVPANAPERLSLTISLEPVFTHHQSERT